MKRSFLMPTSINVRCIFIQIQYPKSLFILADEIPKIQIVIAYLKHPSRNNTAKGISSNRSSDDDGDNDDNDSKAEKKQLTTFFL